MRVVLTEVQEDVASLLISATRIQGDRLSQHGCRMVIEGFRLGAGGESEVDEYSMMQNS